MTYLPLLFALQASTRKLSEVPAKSPGSIAWIGSVPVRDKSFQQAKDLLRNAKVKGRGIESGFRLTRGIAVIYVSSSDAFEAQAVLIAAKKAGKIPSFDIWKKPLLQ